ncbi:MAG: asparagine synthase (glutamine-hydrolyzing) [Bryobacteraceae bacterium]
MCGIAGYVTTVASPFADSVVERMTARLAHRGPDGQGFFRDPHCSLGHRRLAIIDLASGHQPMTSESGELWLTFNGEIFNHADLRPLLERAGHIYKTHCDTETILHAYEQHGEDCPSHFRGMFAFAIWDQRRRRLFCARDRLGIKPFYYYWDGRLFAFASEIKALLAHPSISAALEPALIPEYLAFGYTSSDRTLFAGIRKLMPGHTLTVDAGAASVDIRQYWDIPAPAPDGSRDEAGWIADCRRRLEETVRLRLMSDVPLGMFLSGGVDSSLIAALMKRLTSTPVKTYAVGYAESEYSELGYARQVAACLGTEHREVVVSMRDFFDALPKLVYHEDEPITWPSSVSLYFVSALAAREVKVVLTGEGSDELFAGYGRYRFYLLNRQWMRAWRLVPAPLRRRVRERIASSPWLGAGLRRRLGHTFLARGGELESLYLDNFYSAFPDPSGRASENFARAFDSVAGSTLARMLRADQKTYLVQLLMKQDRMSMATSIESRVPFLDHPLVEFSTRVPDSLKLRGATGKYILKRAAEDLLPRNILYRTKMGFPTPLRAWLRTPEAEPLFARITAPGSLAAEYLDLDSTRALVDRHRRGLEDATDRVWRLLNLELWAGCFLAGRAAPDEAALLSRP